MDLVAVASALGHGCVGEVLLLCFALLLDVDVVDQAIRFGLFRGHVPVAVGVLLNNLNRLAAVVGEDFIKATLGPQNLLGLYADVGRGSLHSPPRLMDHDP